MPETQMQALVWVALAAVLAWSNMKAGRKWLKQITLVGLLGAFGMAALTLLGFVGVPS